MDVWIISSQYLDSPTVLIIAKLQPILTSVLFQKHMGEFMETRLSLLWCNLLSPRMSSTLLVIKPWEYQYRL